MNFPIAALIGFFLGFGFGVGCALAVMYGLYMGGYKKGVQESISGTERYTATHAKITAENRKKN